MADINREDVVIFKSEVLDETNEGGGQMTSAELTNGEINGLFPDISLMDSVYGRVSLRKCFVAVNTPNRATYYGSHLILTKKAEDPLVSILFFTTKDWFDKRQEAQSRIENYKVKGTALGASLWGDHYYGSRTALLQTSPEWADPDIGDVIVFETDEDLSGGSIPIVQQFLRIMDVSSEVREFTIEYNNSFHTFKKKIVTVTFGQILKNDFPGTEVFATTNYTSNPTQIFTSVDADAARYFGVAKLAVDAEINDLVIVVDEVKKAIVPAAQSETGIVDYSIGKATSLIMQSQPIEIPVSRTMSLQLYNGSTFIIGEVVRQGTFSIPSQQITDDGQGQVLKGSTVVGSILYETGYVTWTNLPSNLNFSGTVSYVPGCVSAELGYTGGIYVSANSRGFVYTFNCNPVPVPGSVRIEYMVNGKWYSLWDRGTGLIRGSSVTIGTAVVNFTSGSISISLGELPDIASYILITWSDKAGVIDTSSINPKPFFYDFYLTDKGIVPLSFVMSWTQNSVVYTLTDDASGNILLNSVIVGTINRGEGRVILNNLPVTPQNTQSFDISYQKTNVVDRTFVNPERSDANRIVLDLNNTNAIVPGSLVVEWTNNLVWWKQAQTYNHMFQKQSTYIHKYKDIANDASTGYLENFNTANLTSNWTAAVINYNTGILSLSPDRKETVAITDYAFVNNAEF